MIKWHLEKKKVSELKNWEKNPRTISKKAFKELEKSVDALGNFEPLVINIDGTVIAGNQRLRLEMKKGNNEVDVYVPERKLSEEEVKKIGVISNRHSGDWDMDILANEFDDILNELGFEDLLPEVRLEVEEDDYEEPEQLPSRVQPGEVWLLGDHRLVCGDATKFEDIKKLMNGTKADMVFTDPPYNVDYSGGMHADGTQSKRKKILNDKMNNEDFYQFLLAVMTNLLLHCEGAFYVCMSSSELHNLWKAFTDAGGHWQSYVLWVKNTFTLSRSDYQHQFEPVMYGLSSKAHRELQEKDADLDCEPIMYGWNKHEWYGGRRQGNAWLIDRPNKSELHPTMKPIALCAKAIVNSSKVGGGILDVFGASGSTLTACEQTDRICYMMELDTHYCDVIIDRWEKLTGQVATKL